jgi:hypothetical protein
MGKKIIEIFRRSSACATTIYSGSTVLYSDGTVARDMGVVVLDVMREEFPILFELKEM